MKKLTWKVCVTSGLLSTSLLLGAYSAAADNAGIAKLPQDITFQSVEDGLQVAILYGDPAKLGLYVVRFKLPAGAKVMPHTHPDDVPITVLSGTLFVGFGEQWDEGKLSPYPAGAFLLEPRNLAHFVAAKDGEVVFQATGIGPFPLIPVH